MAPTSSIASPTSRESFDSHSRISTMSKTNLKAGALAAGLGAATLGSLAEGPLPQTVTVDGEKVFPESMTSAADGSVFFGSIGNKMIYRAPPGAAKAGRFA